MILVIQIAYHYTYMWISSSILKMVLRGGGSEISAYYLNDYFLKYVQYVFNAVTENVSVSLNPMLNRMQFKAFIIYEHNSQQLSFLGWKIINYNSWW